MSYPAEVLATAFRLAIFRPADVNRMPTGVFAFALASAASAGLGALSQWLTLGGHLAGDTRIAPEWLASALAYSAITLVVAAAFAWALRLPVLKLATAVALGGLFVQGVWLLLLVWPGPSSPWLQPWLWPWFAFTFWWLMIWLHTARQLRATERAFAMPGAERVKLLLVAVSAFALMLYTGTQKWDFLLVPQVADVSASLADENHFHNHRGVLAEALGDLLPHRPGKTDLYYVGFAPDATDAVFVRESRSIKRIMDERFGTEGRSIALINHRDALSVEPMASATQLQDTLDHIAALMDVNEDVLFLYVTTHGGQDGEWVVSAPPLNLNAVNGRELKRMLDEAGIRWRVLVVSACYSGTALASLADPYTLVMTAADAKQTSFGCGNEYHFTYWGDALFNHGLAKTDSLPEAYDIAAKHVRAREIKDGYTPSNPQLQQGEAIGLKLRELALQWQLDRTLKATRK